MHKRHRGHRARRPFSDFSKTPAARRVNLEDVTRLHLCLANMRQRFNLSVGPHHKVAAYLAWFAAGHTERFMLAAVEQDACPSWLPGI